MTQTTKTILIIIGSVLVLCICGIVALSVTGLWSVAQITKWADTNTTNNLPEVANMLSEIAVITLPDGFGAPYGVHLGDVTLVGFASGNGNTHIILAQFPEGTHVDADQLLKDISQFSRDPKNRWYDTQTRVIQEKPVTIRGQETVLSISEGTSSDGITYRSAVATFPGEGGPALVAIGGPSEEWDLEMVETFVASIQ